VCAEFIPGLLEEIARGEVELQDLDEGAAK